MACVRENHYLRLGHTAREHTDRALILRDPTTRDLGITADSRRRIGKRVDRQYRSLNLRVSLTAVVDRGLDAGAHGRTDRRTLFELAEHALHRRQVTPHRRQ